MSPNNIRSYAHKVSPIWLSKHELNCTTNRHAKVDRSTSRGPRSGARKCRQKNRLRMGERVFPREENTNWLFSSKWSTLKTNIRVVSCGLNRVYFRLCMYIYIYACNKNNEKRPSIWKRVGICMRSLAGGRVRKERSDVIILWPQKYKRENFSDWNWEQYDSKDIKYLGELESIIMWKIIISLSILGSIS